jgi:nitrite reductase (NO-forming)
MDLKPAPARLSAERHQGAFADGAALSMGAELKPLDPAPVKTVRLDTVHKIIEIAPGVKYSAWTFGNQVPGPAIRARVGDRIKFSMTNRTDERMPGVQVTAAPMMHSMDFHAAMVSPQDKYRSIAPGQSSIPRSARWTAHRSTCWTATVCAPRSRPIRSSTACTTAW